MIECTLQEAIKRCRKNGGMIKPKYYHDWITPEELPRWRFNINDFDQPWIYEPPKKSAFQEWEAEQYMVYEPYRDFELRKEGWNAAIDLVLEWVSCDDLSWEEDLRELKEP